MHTHMHMCTHAQLHVCTHTDMSHWAIALLGKYQLKSSGAQKCSLRSETLVF